MHSNPHRYVLEKISSEFVSQVNIWIIMSLISRILLCPQVVYTSSSVKLLVQQIFSLFYFPSLRPGLSRLKYPELGSIIVQPGGVGINNWFPIRGWRLLSLNVHTLTPTHSTLRSRLTLQHIHTYSLHHTTVLFQ